MKEKIEWYQERLNNSSYYHSTQLNDWMRRYESIMLSIAEDDFRKVQIEEAIRQGKDGFDSDKFMKNARLKAMEEAKQRITAQVCQLKAASIH